MGYWSQYTFSGGLNTDNLNAESSLTKAVDAFIDRNGEIRKRGGKTLVGDLITDASYQSLNAFLPQDNTVPGAHFVSVPGTTDSFKTRITGGSSFTSVSSTYRWDNKTTPLSEFDIELFDYPTWTTDGTELFFPNKYNGTILRWSGATMSSNYNTGTVSGTAGNSYVTGSGTSWIGNVTPNSYFIPPTGDEVYRVTGVFSDTELLLDRPLQTTISSSSSYYVTPIAPVTVIGVDGWESGTLQNAVSVWAVGARPAFHAGRLFISGPFEESSESSGGSKGYRALRERIRWSALPGETQSGASSHTGVDYWEADAYADVEPGLGGEIQALVSYGNELLIIKSSATFVLRGAVSTDGSPIGATIDLVSDSIGISNPQAVERTRVGVVLANSEGAFVYSNGRLSPLTHGRVSKEWDTYAPHYSVSGIRDRVVFMNPVQSYALVWDTRLDTFTTQSHASGCSKLVSTYTSTGALEYECGVQSGRVSNWRTDLAPDDTRKNDTGSTTTPRLNIQTKPFALNGKRPFKGRVNNVFVDAYVADAASDDPALSVKLLHGRADDATQATDTHNDVLTENTRDEVFRYPIEGAVDASHAYVNVYQNSGMPAAAVSVFGLGAEFTEVDRV